MRRLALLLAVVVAAAGCGGGAAASSTAAATTAARTATAAATAPATTAADAVRHPEIGFRDRSHLVEHYRKHGREFGAVTLDGYLRLAQALRDAPVGGAVLELTRGDGVVTRFDRRDGAFVAFTHRLVIRTFFRPNDGEAYFRRQAGR